MSKDVDLDAYPKIEIRLFGTFSVKADGRPLESEDLNRSMVRLMLIYLALELGRGIGKGILREKLWSNLTQSRAQENYYATWSRLRRSLSPGTKECPYLISKDEYVALNPDFVQCDTHVFNLLFKKVLYERGSVSDRMADYRHLDEMYRGGLLVGYEDYPHIASWQKRFRFAYTNAMLQGSSLFERNGDAAIAAWLYYRAVEEDPEAVEDTVDTVKPERFFTTITKFERNGFVA
jgi:DNA-binding SARP family transcriptional activator